MIKRIPSIIAISLPIALLFFAGCSTDPNGSGQGGDDSVDGQDGDDKPVVNFPGAGTSGAGKPLVPGVGPETSDDCGDGVFDFDKWLEEPTVIEDSVECYYGEDDPVPAAAIEQVVEIVDDVERIHIRLTLDPRFVDNTFGENAMGWDESKKGEHTFKDLVGSDHAEMKLFDTADKLILHFKIDYLSEADATQYPSGYASLGVSDGDGEMIVGHESSILGTSTSMNRNLNGCELDEYLESSPTTDKLYNPDPQAPEWDYRVVYEVWVDAEPFGSAGFGKAIIEHVHASPSKMSSNTIVVVQGDCPEDEDDGEFGEDDLDDCDPKKEDCDDNEGWVDPV